MSELIRNYESKRTAVVDTSSGLAVSYGELLVRIELAASHIEQISDRSLIFLGAANSIDSIAIYLACLRLKYPVVLLDPNIRDEFLERLVKTYRPTFLLLPSQRNTPPSVGPWSILRRRRLRLGLALGRSRPVGRG